MALVKCKGTSLAQEVGTVSTVIAQIISLDLPDFEAETYEADTLDNTDPGIPYEPTNRVEGGAIGGELFFDPALAGHQALLAILGDPSTLMSSDANPEEMILTFADTGATAWTFTIAGFSFGGTVALNDGLKGTFSAKLNKIPTEFAGYTS